MRRRIFYITSWVFLSLIASPLFFLFGLQSVQFYIKNRTEITLKTKELQTISFSADKVQWVEKDREILVDGKMFDIVSFSVTNNVFTARGIYDEEETQVVNLLNIHLTETKQNYFIIQLLLVTQCFVALVAYYFSFFNGSITSVYKYDLFFRYLNPYLYLIVPPPKTVCVSFH